jgi:predicted dinucleotide-binding enzyme
MKIGIIGSGTVGQHLAEGLLKSGHEVKIGSRTPSKLHSWLQDAGKNASASSVRETAAFGEMIFLATKWADDATQNAIELADKKNLSGKVVVDVTNPLLFKKENQPPVPEVGYPESGGFLVQKWIPQAKVVKAFNIITAGRMANPDMEEGTPDMFICGNDVEAKGQVTGIAENWGWNVIDIGDIEQAYLLEAMAFIWVRYGFQTKQWSHAFKLLKK